MRTLAITTSGQHDSFSLWRAWTLQVQPSSARSAQHTPYTKACVKLVWKVLPTLSPLMKRWRPFRSACRHSAQARKEADDAACKASEAALCQRTSSHTETSRHVLSQAWCIGHGRLCAEPRARSGMPCRLLARRCGGRDGICYTVRNLLHRCVLCRRSLLQTECLSSSTAPHAATHRACHAASNRALAVPCNSCNEAFTSGRGRSESAASEQSAATPLPAQQSRTATVAKGMPYAQPPGGELIMCHT